MRNFNNDAFCPSPKKHDKMKDFAKKQLDLINQQFQFYQEN